MKRSVGGGAARGPVAQGRQRRTLRLMQILLLLIATGLLLFAGYSWGRSSGYEAGRNAEEIDAPARPSNVQTVVLVILGATALGGAFLVQKDGAPRMPTPAKLDELAGRAERAKSDEAQAQVDPTGDPSPR